MKLQVSILLLVAACVSTNGKHLLSDADTIHGNISSDVYDQSNTHVRLSNFQPEYYGYKLPCPNAEEIAPCVCTYDSGTKAMNLTCSAVETEDQLAQIFQSNFPIKNFQWFQFHHNLHLKVLESYVFNDISFEIIDITLNQLNVIENHALVSCYETATEIYFSFNRISSFPFDDLSQFSKLTKFFIVDNSLSMIPANAFHGLTTLEYIDLSTTPNIVGSFENLPNLRDIWLLECDLTVIPNNFINTGSPYLKFIRLSDNNIFSVEPGAIEIVDGLTIYINLNSLKTLEEATWRPLLEAGVELEVRRNPLVCGCDIAWLFDDDQLHKQLIDDATCSNGENIHDLDPSIFDDC